MGPPRGRGGVVAHAWGALGPISICTVGEWLYPCNIRDEDCFQ